MTKVLAIIAVVIISVVAMFGLSAWAWHIAQDEDSRWYSCIIAIWLAILLGAALVGVAVVLDDEND